MLSGNMSKKKHVKKFNLDNDDDRALYEMLLNNNNATILKEEFTYDKTQGNKALITVWWEESDTWALDDII
jgi:hypothetical protein